MAVVAATTRVKVCQKCAQAFAPNSNRQKYCEACGRRDASQCEQCGKVFMMTGNTTGRFCTRSCWRIAARMDGTKPRPCPACGVDFTPLRPSQKTCSRTCGQSFHRTPSRPCLVCGRMFWAKNKRQVTCSRACGAKARRGPRNDHCERCGAAIPFGTYNVRFCSRECRARPLGFRKPVGEGYIKIKVGTAYPGADRAGYILEHRYVIERQIGRPLAPFERVHHKNGRRDDNCPENLELWKLKDPAGVRQADYHCPGCRCFEAPS